MDIVASRILSIPYCRSSRYRPGWPRQEQSKPRTKDRDLLAVSLWYRCGGSGIGGLFGHVFISDSVAESIGWPTGNPFQLEVGFANLAIGILGIIAMGRRDGFREATVIAVTVFGVGATIVHVSDIIQTGNLAPGNTIQNVGNLLKPALLIGFLLPAGGRNAPLTPKLIPRGSTHGDGPGYRPPVW
jgi:hypothetical protein